MKKIITIILICVVLLNLGASAVYAEDGFIRSVGAYSGDFVVINEDGGNPGNDVVATIHNGQDTPTKEDVTRGHITIVNSTATETPENKARLDEMKLLIQQIAAAKSVEPLITTELAEELRDNGVEPSNLDVGIVFDITLQGQLEANETLQFSIKNPALLAMTNSDIYSGRIIIFQKNTATDEFEALNPKGEQYFDGGWYELNGDVITIRVSHLCVFMISAEIIPVEKAPCCGWCSLLHCCDGGCECEGFCLCCYWWILLLAAIVIILIILLFLYKKAKKEETNKASAVPTDPPASAEPTVEQTTPVEQAPVEEKDTFVPPEEPYVPAGMTLSEAIAISVAHSNTARSVTKETVAEFLENSYGNKVVLNRRENYVKNKALPLADTHYKVLAGGNKCFAYVYELRGGHVFFLLRCNEYVANEISKNHPSFTRSAYPKSKAQDWYTLVPDESFASVSEVFDVLAFVFENFRASDVAALRSSVDVLTARALYSDREIERLVQSTARFGDAGKEVIINVDTLCEEFEDGDEITLAKIKEKHLISPKGKRLKVLARGQLSKSFTVVADSFSADAAKMIIAMGGRVIQLKQKPSSK